MKKLLSFVALIFSLQVFAADLTKLEYITETYPPYNFKEEGKLKGIAVELLEAATKAAGHPVKNSDIKLQPWARGYRQALSGKMTALFSTSRTEERESKFQWVGPITDTRIVVWAPKAKGIKIGSAADLKSYKIGAIRDDVGEQLVKAAGVPEGNIKLSPKPEAVAKKLQSGRVDLWAYEENVAAFIMKANGINTADFEVVHVLKEAKLFYSLSKDVSGDIVSKLQGGVDKVKSSGDFDKILSKYR